MKNKGPLEILLKLKDLELHTDAGRINYRWGILLVFFIIALTAGDALLVAFAYAISLIKTCVLKRNILETPEVVDIKWLLVAIILFFIMCICIVYSSERAKEKLDKKMDEVEERTNAEGLQD